jgi:NADP-dependent 3-hydroxy acid dehydrogenase YdfG
MKKIALITGATSGIGKACAYKLAEQKYDLILNGRREDRLSEIKKEIEAKFGNNVLPLAFDISHKDSVNKAINCLDDKWKNISVLVKNAGLALGRDNFLDADLEDWDIMLQTNVNGIMYITKALLPVMINNGNAHIVNIGSIAGKEVYENGNAYCASKFAVDALSKSMRIDLLKYGIKVTVIHPGAVETEFSVVRYKGDQEKADATYKGFTPLKGDDIADAVSYAINLPQHVCINEMVITPTQQANAIHFHKK